ncbi:MAG: thioredoxin [Cyanobacteria bacterium P01_F01_bin.150]
MDKVLALGETQLDKLLKVEGLVIALDFTATWCGPCKVVAPVMQQLAEDYWKRAAVAKVDVDESKDVAKRYGIRSIPAVLIIKEGEVVERVVGAKSYEFYKDLVDKHL